MTNRAIRSERVDDDDDWKQREKEKMMIGFVAISGRRTKNTHTLMWTEVHYKY